MECEIFQSFMTQERLLNTEYNITIKLQVLCARNFVGKEIR